MKKHFELFFLFFKIGLFTFGGGYAMIANLKEELVDKKKWIKERELLEMITIAESTPGPIAINMATFVGYKQKKILGSFFATIGVVLPSFIIIFSIFLLLDSFIDNKYVVYAFTGIKVGVAFLILRTGKELFLKMEKNIFSLVVFTIVTVLVLLLDVFSINFSSILFILIGALLGISYSLIIKKENLI